jgi:hypothetical protein
MAECSITTLTTDACSNGFYGAAQNEKQFWALVLQLLCNISSGGGGTTCGDYGGGEPDFTPGSSCAIAIDTSNDSLWVYRSGAWAEYIAGP